MPQDLTQTFALLRNTPAALNALLRDLPTSWTHSNEGASTWTIYDVVGHLAYGETSDWPARAKIILEHGGSRPFTPFDRLGQVSSSQGKVLPQLLDEFATLRARNLSELESLNLTPEDLDRRGAHPSFGPVTLSQLLAAWAIHDMSHLHQISRILSHQYREAVGPWQKFLGVLHCDGHSSPA
jgi:hypothetical protein